MDDDESKKKVDRELGEVYVLLGKKRGTVCWASEFHDKSFKSN